MNMLLVTVKVEKPDDTNFILGQTHFIKSVEDNHEALVAAQPFASVVVEEFYLGRLALGLPWDRITEDYDPARGGFLGFGLLFMAVSPLLAAKIPGHKRRSLPPHR
jgi:hypothetical protein